MRCCYLPCKDNIQGMGSCYSNIAYVILVSPCTTSHDCPCHKPNCNSCNYPYCVCHTFPSLSINARFDIARASSLSSISCSHSCPAGLSSSKAQSSCLVICNELVQFVNCLLRCHENHLFLISHLKIYASPHFSCVSFSSS